MKIFRKPSILFILFFTFVSFATLSTAIFIFDIFSDYKRNSALAIDNSSKKTLNIFISQIKQFLSRRLLAAENFSVIAKYQKKNNISDHFCSVDSIALFEAMNIYKVAFIYEVGKTLVLTRKNFQNDNYSLSNNFSHGYISSFVKFADEENIKETQLDVKDNSTNVEESTYNHRGEITSQKKFDFSKKLQSYISSELVDGVFFSDLRETDWYNKAKRTKMPCWHTPVESNKESGFFSYLVYPIMDENNIFIGVTVIYVPVSEFAELGKIFLLENSLTQVCLFDSKEKIILDTTSKAFHTTDDQGRQSLRSITSLREAEFGKSYAEYKDKGKPNQFLLNHKSSIDGEQLTYFYKLPNDFYANWTLVVNLKKDPITYLIRQDFIYNITIFFIRLFLLSLGVIWLARLLSRPLRAVTLQMENMAKLLPCQLPKIRSWIGEIQNLLNSLGVLRESSVILQQLVPKKLIQTFVEEKQSFSIGGHKKEITVFFCNLKNFSLLLSKTSAENVFQYLSSYFEIFTKIILKNNGTLDKYDGDTIMAFWGDPITEKNHTELACGAALECLQLTVNILNPKLVHEENVIMDMAFGITTGYAIVGMAGSNDRLQYTTYGDIVNLSSRLKDLNKYYGTNILVNEETYLKTSYLFIFRPIDFVKIRGKEQPVLVYEMLAPYDHKSLEACGNGAQTWTVQQYMHFVVTATDAWEAYRNCKWKLAEQLYKAILKIFPTDSVSPIFIKRCEYFQKNPPPENWDGIFND